MTLFLRLVRALWVFGLIFFSYLAQYGLTLLVERWEKDPTTGREYQELPDWVKRRRKRLDQRNAKRLLGGMLELRGVYIKLGQILSIMGGFLPRAFTKELEQLQDAVPPQPYATIERAFFESLGKLPHDCFERFDETPLAAASLGQVHVAWLPPETPGGEPRKVAVKVLYPGIRDVIAVDVQVIYLAVQVYQWFVPVRGLERVYESLLDLLRRETEYEHEARCMARMKQNFAREKDVLFPSVVTELSSSDVLTMTFMEGTKINKIEEIKAQNIEPRAVAIRFVESFYKQIFIDRFFHADPHPGNFLVQPGRNPRRPKLVVLDFGAISEVEQPMVDGMIEVIGGLMEQDGARLLDGFFQMGFASKEANRELLEKTVQSYFEKLLRIKDRTPGALMRANQRELEALVDPEVARDELRELMKSVEYPQGWFYLERAVVMSFWLCAQIDPELDTMQVGYPYILPLIEEAKRRGGRRSERPPSIDTDAGEGATIDPASTASETNESEATAASDGDAHERTEGVSGDRPISVASASSTRPPAPAVAE
ncbi:MAG: AarF/ABC1/UbiB kinase family protein [Deltaproteobacteria bacterium]|nr:AarF/ABC1/UbiB kinase family protein [Deltaproteobacteria bacterium]